jgi:glycosyltransferase involved in cell wall biosynthesis
MKEHRRRLICVTTTSVADAPYYDFALPWLAADGWEITLTAPGASRSLIRGISPYPATIRDIPGEREGSRAIRELRLALELLRARFGSYDAVLIAGQSISARAAVLLAGMRGKALAYHAPEMYDPFDHPAHWRLLGCLSRRADLYLNAEYHRAYISRAMYRIRAPIVILPPNLPSTWPIPRIAADVRARMCGDKASHDAFVLMLHGGYSERRLVPELLHGLAMLPRTVRLVMTNVEHRKGEADRTLARLGIEDRVLRLPRMAFGDMLAYSVNADAGVLLYKNNDLGNFFTSPGRLTEYLACGLPVLASNHTGLEALVLRHGLGETTREPTPEAIADAIRALMERKATGVLGREVMRETFVRTFASDNFRDRVVEAFRTLTPDGRHAALRPPPPFPWLQRAPLKEHHTRCERDDA